MATTDSIPMLRETPAGGLEPIPWDVCGCADRGGARGVNQDNFLVAEMWRVVTLRHSSLPSGAKRHGATQRFGHILAVAHGMGDHGAGEQASRAALAELAELTLAQLEGGESDPDGLRRLISACEDRVHREALAGDHDLPLPGTTLTAALVLWPYVHLAHVGDTRCYLIREGRSTRLTRDHPNAVGGACGPASADVHRLELSAGDALVMCSDGLTRSVTDSEIAGTVSGTVSARQACDALLAAALEREGGVNVTAVVARF